VNTRRSNLGPNHIHDKGESLNLEVRIANLTEQIAQAQKNMEDLVAQNALLQVAQTTPPSHQPTGAEKNSRTERRRLAGGDPSFHQEGSGERIEPRVPNPDNLPPPENQAPLENHALP
jgi:hypothetical protein